VDDATKKQAVAKQPVRAEAVVVGPGFGQGLAVFAVDGVAGRRE